MAAFADGSRRRGQNPTILDIHAAQPLPGSFTEQLLSSVGLATVSVGPAAQFAALDSWGASAFPDSSGLFRALNFGKSL
jgi:hypothetical protein